jgi:DNA-binding beta-propeller fold protein YncE
VNNTGFLAAFAVSAGCAGAPQRRTPAANVVRQQAVRSSPDGTAVLFGSSTIPGSSDLFVTDASFGAAVLSIDPQTDVATVAGKGVVDGQKATCWVAISPSTNTAFVTDVGTNRLVEMSITDASVLGQIDLSANGDPGLIDLRAAGRFVYALSPGNGTSPAAVTVVDVMAKKQVQHFMLQSVGAGKNAQGMAVLL